jgi:endonuclease-8
MALLDQRNLAGSATSTAARCCSCRGLTPWVRVADVPDLPALVDKGRRLLLANRGRWEQSTTGSLRYGEMHWVFERSGKACRRCGTRIATAEQGAHRTPA